MHEGTLIKDLVKKINELALAEGATRVDGVRVKVGEFSHVSADHLREHFVHESRGTLCEGARVDVDMISGLDNPDSLEIILETIDLDIPDVVEMAGTPV
jgi:hydrogenase nickel incorporation protein HypA/HybF